MKAFAWLWNILWAMYMISWLLRDRWHFPLRVYLVAIVWVAVPYAYRYWRDQRDARDNYPDMRGELPGRRDEESLP